MREPPALPHHRDRIRDLATATLTEKDPTNCRTADGGALQSANLVRTSPVATGVNSMTVCAARMRESSPQLSVLDLDGWLCLDGCRSAIRNSGNHGK